MVFLGFTVFVFAGLFIYRNYDCREVWLIGGLILGILSGRLLSAIDAMVLAVVQSESIVGVAAVLGYAYLMEKNSCQGALGELIEQLPARLLKMLPLIAFVLTFCINIMVPSALECSALVGSLIIPLLLKQNISPTIAAATVVCGTWGSIFSTVSAQNTRIAELMGINPLVVVQGQAQVAIVGLIIFSIILYNLNRKQVQEEEFQPQDTKVYINYRKAFWPLLPLIIMIIGSMPISGMIRINLFQAVTVSIFLVYMVGQSGLKITNFFVGVGDGVGQIISFLLCAMFFAASFEFIGGYDYLIQIFNASTLPAPLLATIQPMLVAFFSGSGDLAGMTFINGGRAVMSINNSGLLPLYSQAYLSASLGRCLSPLAGSVIICAQFAGTGILSVVKINAVIMVAIALVSMLQLM